MGMRETEVGARSGRLEPDARLVRPDLVCPGAQKSASTFLSRWLDAHPNIHMRRGEYPGFEDPDYEREKLTDLELALPPEIACYGIRRADYLTDALAAQRLHEHLPDARILITLRDPVTRAISGYHHYVAYGLLPPRSADAGLRRIFGGPTAGKPLSQAERNVRDYGEYPRHVARYFDLFGRENVKVVLQTDLAEGSAKATYASLCEFIGVEPLDVEPPGKRAQRTTTNMLALKARSFGNRYRYDRHFDRARSYSREKAALPGWQQFVIKASARAQELVVAKLPAKDDLVSAETLAAMHRHYDPQIPELEQLLGRDLSTWRHDAAASASG